MCSGPVVWMREWKDLQVFVGSRIHNSWWLAEWEREAKEKEVSGELVVNMGWTPRGIVCGDDFRTCSQTLRHASHPGGVWFSLEYGLALVTHFQWLESLWVMLYGFWALTIKGDTTSTWLSVPNHHAVQKPRPLRKSKILSLIQLSTQLTASPTCQTSDWAVLGMAPPMLYWAS